MDIQSVWIFKLFPVQLINVALLLSYSQAMLEKHHCVSLFFKLIFVWFFVCLDLQNLKTLGLAYFLYLFLFSGLEYTLSFLTHQRFQFTRYSTLTR